MKRRRRQILIGLGLLAFGLGLLALGLLAYDRLSVMRWIGRTELTIEFVVTDADSGKPIEGAELHAVDPESSTAPAILLISDRDGIARWQGDAKTVGEMSNLRLTNTRAVHPPVWSVTALTRGYRDSEPLRLHEHARNIVQTGPLSAKLVLSIPLRRIAP
jgi:hypothetical protein